MTNRNKGYLFAAISAASYGVNPLAIIMYNDGLTVDDVLFYRYSMAAILMAILIFVRHESFRLTFNELFLLLGLGLLFSISSIALFISYKYIDVSIASTLLFCYPAIVTIIMMTFFKERPNWITLTSVIIVAIGIFILNYGSYGSVSNILGVVIVILSSLSYAIYIVCIQKTRLRKMSSLKVGFYSILFGNLIYIVRLNWFINLQEIPTTRSAICLSILAIFPTLISLTTLAKAIKYIGSTHSSIIGALEPVTAVLIGIIVFNERPSAIEIVGMLIVIFAVTMLVTIRKKNQ